MPGSAPTVLHRAARASLGRLRHEWRGWALAFCILAVHFAGVGHRAFERHVLCADHGEWTHEDACAPVHDGHEHLEHRGAGHQCDACEDDPVQQDHEHCLLATLARLDGGTPPPDEVRLPALLPAARPVPQAAPATPCAALEPLVLAPKQSPPAT